MSPLRLFLLCFALMAGCAKGTDTGKVFVPQQGHPAPWASYLAVGTSDFHATVVTSALPGQSAGRGAELFLRHCAPCHASTAMGKVGPNILTILQAAPDIPGTITSTIHAVPLMQGQAILSSADIGNIAGYLSALIAGGTAVPEVSDTTLCSQCHGTDLNGGIARVSCFACHNGPDGSIGHPAGWLDASGGPAGFHGSYGRDFLEGCKTCHGVDLNGSIVFASGAGTAPACSRCHNGVAAPLL